MEKTTGIGARIRERRRELKISAVELARAGGITENALRKLEAGAYAEPRFTTGLRLANALRLPPMALLNGRKSGIGAPDLATVIRAIRTRRADLQAAGAQHIDIFGSVARGTASAQSDIDIIATPRPGATFSLIDLSGVVRMLEESTGRSVDILTSENIRPERFDTKILEEAVRVF